MSTSYNVYIDGNRTVQSFDPSDTLAEVRTALTNAGLMKSTDRFLYKSQMTQKTTVIPKSDENVGHVSGATFPAVPKELPNSYELMQIVNTDKNDPSILGTSPKDGYFRKGGQFAVSVKLNDSDPDAISNNKGMFEPVLLQDVVSSNPDAPVTFDNCVIVQKGAIISFDIASWGAAGYGYIVEAAEDIGGENICPGAFACYDNVSLKYGTTGLSVLNRYLQSGDTIQIESNKSMNIAKQYNVEYSTVTVKTFSLTQWTALDGTVYSSDLSIPSTPAEALGMSEEEAKKGWAPPPPAGGADVPSGTVTSGGPKAGPPSQQQFGGIQSVKPTSCPATRAGGLVNSIDIYFLVFDSKEDANTVINVLNAGTMQI